MSGLDEKREGDSYYSPSSEGLIPRSIRYMFSELQRTSDWILRKRQQQPQQQQQTQQAQPRAGKWSIRCSALEVYNETIRDLLHPGGGLNSGPQGNSGAGQHLSLRQATDGSFFCEGCLSVSCESMEDVMAVSAEAHKNRVVRSHALNNDSSRSHAIFLLALEREIPAHPNDPNSAATIMRYGKVSNIHDAAMGERSRRGGKEGEEG